MDKTAFLSLMAYIVAVGYSPGPANLFTLSCTFKYGRAAAFRMWWGLMAGFTIAVWTMAAVCCAMGDALGPYVVYLKYVGAAYILYLAWGVAFRGRRRARDGTCTFLSGLFVQLTNAKMLLFDILIFGMFVMAKGNRWQDYVVVGLLLYIAGPGGNLAWLLGGVLLRKVYEAYPRLIDGTLGLTMAIFAVLSCVAV